MLKILKEKMIKVLVEMLVRSGELALQQCCWGFSHEIEIPEELVK